MQPVAAARWPLPSLASPASRAGWPSGEEVEVQIRYTPRAAGNSVVYGVCELAGTTKPMGFRVVSTIQVRAVRASPAEGRRRARLGCLPSGQVGGGGGSEELGEGPLVEARWQLMVQG